MRSLKQSEASRINGAKSHGPVSAEGKSRSAANSTTHGFYSQTVVLENEDPYLYQQWLDDFIAAWQPVDKHEHHLVTDIVDARWRIRRYNILESKALDFEVGRLRPELDKAFIEIDEGTRTVFGLTSLLSLNRTFEVLQSVIRTQHRIIDRASRQLTERRRQRGQSPAVAVFPQAVDEQISENEPEAAQEPDTAPPAPDPQPDPAPRPSQAAKSDVLPPNWRNEPELATAPETEAAMQQLLNSMLREKFGPDALASLAKMRR